MSKSIVVILIFVFLTASTLIANGSVSSSTLVENFWVTKARMHRARDSLGVVAVNGKIYAIGGYNEGVMSTNEEYNPVSDVWVSKASMPTPRRSFGIAVYQNRIFCIGGYSPNYASQGSYVAINEVYDLETDAWETRTPMPKSMDLLSAYVVNDKIYLTSGYFDWGPNMSSNLNMVYDPETDSWATRTSPPHRILTALGVVDNKIYYLGYRLTDSHESPTEGIMQIYDPESDEWTIKTPAPDHVFGAAGVTSGVNAPRRIYLFDQNNPVTHVYDVANGSWASVGAQMPTIPRWHAMAAVINDTFYVIGGSLTKETLPIWTTTYYATNEQYTPFQFGTVPAVSITSPKNIKYASEDVQLNFSTTEITSWMGYSLDDKTNVTVTGNTTLSGLSEGAHSLVVYATNFAGDFTSSVIMDFSIDVSSPRIIILSPENKTYFMSDVFLYFSVNESTSQMYYRLDGGDIVIIEGNETLTGLFQGTHNITVYATDTAGNVGASEILSFTIAQEPFPTTLVIASVITIAVVGVGLLVYFKKLKH